MKQFNIFIWQNDLFVDCYSEDEDDFYTDSDEDEFYESEEDIQSLDEKKGNFDKFL